MGRERLRQSDRADRRDRLEHDGGKGRIDVRLDRVDEQCCRNGQNEVGDKDRERLAENALFDAAFADRDVLFAAHDGEHAHHDDGEGAHLDAAARTARAGADEH